MEKRMTLKFLRIAGASFLFTMIVVSVCTSLFLLPVSKDTMFFIYCIYFYIYYITVTATSLYFGYWVTRRNCKYFREFLFVCFIHTVLSTLALLCALYVILFLMDLMNTGDGSRIFSTVKALSFSDYKFALVSPISFFLGGGFYWVYHRSEDDT